MTNNKMIIENNTNNNIDVQDKVFIYPPLVINENICASSIFKSNLYDNNYKTMVEHVLAIKTYVRSNSRSHFYVKNKNIIITDYTFPRSMLLTPSCVCNKNKDHWIKKEYTEEEFNTLINNEMKWHINNPCNYWELPNEYYNKN